MWHLIVGIYCNLMEFLFVCEFFTLPGLCSSWGKLRLIGNKIVMLIMALLLNELNMLSNEMNILNWFLGLCQSCQIVVFGYQSGKTYFPPLKNNNNFYKNHQLGGRDSHCCSKTQVSCPDPTNNQILLEINLIKMISEFF